MPFGFRSETPGNRNTDTNAYRGGCDGLMAQMANRAGVSGCVGVMMPDSAQGRPDYQRKQRDGQGQTPNLL
jgi:hypothetical protein